MLFKDLPIQKKLMRIILLISGIMLLVICTSFFFYELYTFKKAAVQKLSILGEVIANNSTAALAFNNVEDANQILSALKAEPHITAAYLYDKDHKLFSKYTAGIADSVPAVDPNGAGYRFRDTYIEGFQPVAEGTRHLGILYLRSDLGEMYARMRLYGIVTFLVIIVSFLLAYLLSKIFQKSISKPILVLAETAKTISANKDYSIRAVKSGNDELGSLTDSFNTMLAEIDKQNKILSEYNEELARNIIERKKSAATLEKYTHDLEHSNKELEQFAYIASHDLQEPLRMVGSFVQLLENKYKGKLDAEANEFIRFAVDGAARMKQLIKDLLNYSRTNREIQVKEINIADVLGEVKKNLTASIIETNARVDYDGMPVIKADHTQMVQLFQNLISNAIKFRKEDIAPVIRIKAQQENSRWLFSVSDNGIGIEKEYSDKIFVIFRQLNDKAKYGGTGIGLAIAKKIVERYDGKIWFESEFGKGTTFYFTLKNIHS